MNYDAITDFLARVKKLNRATSKDMRLSFDEANALAVNLAELMLGAVQESNSRPVSLTPTIIDGGSFPKRNG